MPTNSSATSSVMEQIRRKRETSFDIDNIVIPYSTMASARVGRDYLASYSTLVETLVDCLIFVGGQMEDVTLEMIIATLQKLSLK